MIGRMADRDTRFEALRSNGLNAYARFHAVVTDRQALAEWRASAQAHQLTEIAAFTALAATLPEPTEDLPFSMIASVAEQAFDGELRDWSALGNASGRTEASELPGWLSANH